VLFVEYCYRDQIKEDEICWACNTKYNSDLGEQGVHERVVLSGTLKIRCEGVD